MPCSLFRKEASPLSPAMTGHGGDRRRGSGATCSPTTGSANWRKVKRKSGGGEETGIKRRESRCREMLGQIWSAAAARVLYAFFLSPLAVATWPAARPFLLDFALSHAKPWSVSSSPSLLPCSAGPAFLVLGLSIAMAGAADQVVRTYFFRSATQDDALPLSRMTRPTRIYDSGGVL